VPEASVFTTARDVFSVIGVVLTAGGLWWRIYTWRHDRQAHVEVELANALPVIVGEVGDHSFQITATNRGDHPVTITSAGFVTQDGRDMVMLKTPFPDALPCVVPPRDSRQTFMASETLEEAGLEVYGHIRGFVRISTGERYESKPRVLMERDEGTRG
jgi:hypothetical protein